MINPSRYYPISGREELEGVIYDWAFISFDDETLQYSVNGEPLHAVTLSQTSGVFRRYLQERALERSNSEQAVKDRARERAIEILETGDPRAFILDTFKTQHIGDNETAEGILIGTANQSIANSKGIQSAVFGESGRGKSHSTRAMLHLFPENYFIIASLSDKALFYLEGDELRAGMTIFSDDAKPSEGIEGIIKRSTAFFQDETVHKVATKEGGKWTTKNLKIPERINWLLTSVDSQGSEQLVNRQIGFGVDETPEQDERVMAFELEKARNGLPEFEVTEDVLTCREILLNIKEDETGAQRLFTVKIPFAKRIEWLDKANRRNLPIFLDMVKGYAVLNFKKRTIVDGAIIATEDDFKAAERLYNTRGGFQKLHIHEREKEMIQHITANGGELSTEELMRKLNLSDVRVRQIAERLVTVLPNFYVEKRSEYVRDASDDSKSCGTRRNYYCYNGAVTIDLFGSVVSLREPTPEEHEEEEHSNTLTTLKDHFNPPPLKVLFENEKPQNEQIKANEEFNNNINNNNNNIIDNKTTLKPQTEEYIRARARVSSHDEGSSAFEHGQTEVPDNPIFNSDNGNGLDPNVKVLVKVPSNALKVLDNRLVDQAELAKTIHDVMVLWRDDRMSATSRVKQPYLVSVICAKIRRNYPKWASYPIEEFIDRLSASDAEIQTLLAELTESAS